MFVMMTTTSLSVIQFYEGADEQTANNNYNNVMRRLFNLHFRCSASDMFANCNIHSVDDIRRTCISSFMQCNHHMFCVIHFHSEMCHMESLV